MRGEVSMLALFDTTSGKPQVRSRWLEIQRSVFMTGRDSVYNVLGGERFVDVVQREGTRCAESPSTHALWCPYGAVGRGAESTRYRGSSPSPTTRGDPGIRGGD